jgi:hypothetical protein
MNLGCWLDAEGHLSKRRELPCEIGAIAIALISRKLQTNTTVTDLRPRLTMAQ